MTLAFLGGYVRKAVLMAIITLGGGVAAISGSIGGTTFSRNRGGPYMRTRAIPVNPNTIFQQAVRSIVSQLTSLWLNTLTDSQRAAWDTYSENVPLPNSLGQPRNVGGLAMYVRSNVPRLQGPLPRVDDAPTIFNLGDYTAPTITVASATPSFTTDFTDTDDWVGEDDAGLLLYGSRGQNESINYFKGPYRFADSILGDATTPPTSPVVISNPFPLAVGQRLFVRAQVARADGRLSADFRTFQIVT